MQHQFETEPDELIVRAVYSFVAATRAAGATVVRLTPQYTRYTATAHICRGTHRCGVTVVPSIMQMALIRQHIAVESSKSSKHACNVTVRDPE
eukprot:2242-Heterococcus_DN1.PRE.1